MSLQRTCLAALMMLLATALPAQAPPSGNDELVLPDKASTQTLALELARLSTHVEELRTLADRPAYDVNPEATVDATLATSRGACGQLAVLRPELRERAESLADRAERILRFLEQDYAASDRPRVANSIRHLGELQVAISAEAAPLLGGGAPDAEQGGKDGSWVPPGFEDRAFRSSLRGRSARSLLSELPANRSALARAVTRDEKFTACTRMAESARELASRAPSLSDSSRRPFLNTALRADVIAENIYIYSLRGDAERLERQLRLMREVEGELKAFLDVNGL